MSDVLQEEDNIPLRILLLLMDEIFDLKHRWDTLSARFTN